MFNKKQLNVKGLTLVEIIVVIAVLTLLAGLIIPAITGVSQDAKATKILAVIDTLKKAVMEHYSHTGTLATEYSGYTDPKKHELSIKQKTPGWRGPYIDHPLSTGDNPFGGYVYVYENFNWGGPAPKSFNLLGKGGKAKGKGQYVAFGNIPQDVAKMVDDALDKGIKGNWTRTGRVEYEKKAKRLNVFLMDVED